MPTMVMNMKINDFDTWKKSFLGMEEHRQKAGITKSNIFKGEDGKEVVILFEASDEAKARELFGSQAVKDAMKRGGVVGAPRQGSVSS